MLNTQSIARAAAEALGGEPVKPPALKVQPIAAKKAAPVPTGNAEARAAFQAKHIVPIAPATGNPTFDAPPAELVERSAKVRLIRERLSGLIGAIERERTALLPELDAMLPRSAELILGEAFDPAAALAFLNDLHATIEGLAPKPGPKPAKTKAEN